MTAVDTERSRLVTWDDPRPGAEAAHTMSGLEYLQAIIRGDFPPPPIARLLGMELVSCEAGRATFALEAAEYLYNPIGSVHGGIAGILTDSAMGCAVHTLLPAGVAYSTVEIKVNLVRAIRSSTGRLICEGSVLHLGRSTALAEAKVVDTGGKLCAHATSTCLILR